MLLNRFVAAVLFVLFAVVGTATHVQALDAVNVPLDGTTLDLTKAVERASRDPSDRVQVSTAPGPDGIVRRIEVRSNEAGGTSYWVSFALTNNGDEQIDRLLVAP
ncbi:MAG TPA: sensor domain-containing phosphodiesterase, partial [Kaistia sp.]|nr:sensor domain-containing phosphodiesterase [Kaistia sp.]